MAAALNARIVRRFAGAFCHDIRGSRNVGSTCAEVNAVFAIINVDVGSIDNDRSGSYILLYLSKVKF